MKVLQINSVCGYGSTGRIATDLYKILEDQGHESLIAYGRGTAPEGIKSIKIGTNFDNYKHVAITRLLDKHGFASEIATKEFIKKAKDYNPDIIHLHNIHGYYINIEILFNYLKEINKPVVWTLHDCWAFTGHCSHFDYVGCEKWRDGCNNCPQKKSYPKSILIDNSKQNYMRKRELFTGIKNLTIITPSNWLAGLVRQSFLKEYNLKVINNGIDLTSFKPNDESQFKIKYHIKNKFMILGVASPWREEKGFNYFLELSKVISNDEIIVMVGLNKKQIEQLPANIIGIERTNNIDELVDIYSAADVFVNTTLEEVLGLVNIEALACGIPVITFKSGGSVECIDNQCGFIVEKGDLDQLIKYINLVKQNTKRFYYSNCINRARKLFNKNDRFYEYLSLYNNLWV